MKNTYRWYGLATIASAILISTYAHYWPTATLENTTPTVENATDKTPMTQSSVNNLKEQKKLLAKANFGRMPLHFEPNQGQTADEVTFTARAPGYQLFLTGSEAVMVLQEPRSADKSAKDKPITTAKQRVVHMQPVGDKLNPKPTISGQERLPGISSYFHGRDQKQWRAGVPHYAKVRYNELYPGIAMEYYGNPQELEYDFVVQPGADPEQIRLAFQGIDEIEVNTNGDLLLKVGDHRMVQKKPVIYQRIGDKTLPIDGGYRLYPQPDKKALPEIGFQLAAWQPDQELVIDPVLKYSTYLGGGMNVSGGSNAGYDEGKDITLDAAGNYLLTGWTRSSDFPTGNILGASSEEEPKGASFDESKECFISKINATGDTLLWSVFLGGSENDECNAIASDQSNWNGDIYVTGETYSGDFPVFNAMDDELNGTTDAFVARIDSSGTSIYFSTYLGGMSYDFGTDIALDRYSSPCVTGGTESGDFPTHFDLFGYSGFIDAYVTCLNNTGYGINFSTYYGGISSDHAQAITIDFAESADHVYLTGSTNSTDLPVFNAIDSTHNGGFDAFIARIDLENYSYVPSLGYSTYLGGGNDETGYGIAVDSAGNVLVAGDTDSTDFPAINAYQSSLATGTFAPSDAFVTKLNPTGTGVAYSTYLGGVNTDAAYDIAVDEVGHAYVTGIAYSTWDFPVEKPIDDPVVSPNIFISKFAVDGSELAWSTLMGGDGGSEGQGITIDDTGQAIVTGRTSSTSEFPVVNALDANHNGGNDAFIASICSEPYPAPKPISPAGPVSTGQQSFQWQESYIATWYRLWVQDQTGKIIDRWYRAEELDCGNGLNTCVATPNEVPANGNSTWWVLAWNACGTSEWSEAQQFDVGATSPPIDQPELIAPVGIITTGTPTYEWEAVDNASWYQLWVGDATPDILNWYKASDIGCPNGNDICSVQPTTVVTGNQTWWIRTWNSAGYGPWGQAMSFTAP